MRRFFDRARQIVLAGILPLLIGCGAPGEPESGTARGPVVLAATSLQESLAEVAGTWEAKGHAAPVLSFAASSALARQAGQGAPADLFVSADEAWMDWLEERGLLRPGTRADLLGNRLVLIAPRGQPATGLAELGSGRLALADPGAVPAGRYAKAALVRLGEWEAVADKVVPAENVRAALALVERGEASLGIVYATDALASERVRVVRELAPDSHPPIRYPVAVLAASTNPDAAAFREFIASDEAMAIFVRHGFEAAR